MLCNCVLLVHTNMLGPTQLVQINMPVSFLSNMLDATAVMVSGVVGMLTESVQDVQHTGFFQAVVKNAQTRVHADGNRAWRSQARVHKLKFSSVAHSKMQFTKRVGSKRLLTGTQKLDGFWKLHEIAEKICAESDQNKRFERQAHM